MSEREEQMLRAIMREMVKAAGEPMSEAQIHLMIEKFFVLEPSLFEIQATMKVAQDKGWVQGKPSATNRMRWAITEKGEFAKV